ncbi:imidazolonepropionase [Pseudactinotalea sp. Z1732]|uniref:imidazolonepropionase n=1 Tax=Micrococcales TaxID=85006 RepID=UPI003C7B17A3
MAAIAITGIAELVTGDPALGTGPLGVLEDAALVIETDDDAASAGGLPGPGGSAPVAGDGVSRPRGRVAWVGRGRATPAADARIDVDGACVLPGFVDSHTHLVFAGDRSAEFAARMSGQSYDGGGIAVTVAATREASTRVLRERLRAFVAEARAQGTTTMEVKSGYGLDVANEVRSLQLAAEVTPEVTFLGAHVVPPEFAGRADAYVDLVRGPMLRECAPHARWVDVFCEPAAASAFDGEQSRAVLEAGARAGLGLRVHGNQLGYGPGAQLAVELGAVSVDHCTYLSDEDVMALAGSDTVATLLPGVEFSTRSPYPDARRLLDAGVAVALSTDCNPGTSFTSSMPLCIALAVREMGMSVDEAIQAATTGGAAALRREDVGHLGVGARADLAVLDAPTRTHLAYRPGVPLARTLEWGEHAGG